MKNEQPRKNKTTVGSNPTRKPTAPRHRKSGNRKRNAMDEKQRLRTNHNKSGKKNSDICKETATYANPKKSKPSLQTNNAVTQEKKTLSKVTP